MIKNYMTQDDVIDELKERTGYYKYNIQEVLDALEGIIIEHMNSATYDEPSEMRLFKSWRLGAKRIPERESIDPRDRSAIITPEKVVPYCKFKVSFVRKLNRLDLEEEVEEDGEDI